MAMSPRLLRPKASGGYHPEALAWRTAAIANGGSVSAATTKAVSDLCRAVDAGNLRDRFVRLNLCCGDNVQAALVPLYRGPSPSGTQYGNPVDGNVGPFITGSNYTQATGFVADNASYLEPGLDIGTLVSAGMQYDEAHTSMWFMGSPSQADMGGVDYWTCYGANGSDGLLAYAANASGYMTSVANGGDYDMTANSGGIGLHLASRSSGAAAYWVNGASASPTVNSSGGSAWAADSALPLAVLGSFYTDESCSNNITPSYNGAGIGAYSLGLGMGASGMRYSWYAIMLAFQQAVGRA